MVKVIKLFILASGLAATAFSLNQRIQTNKIGSITSRNQLPIQNARGSALMMSEESAPAPAPAAEVVASAPKKSFIDFIWNEQTKLGIYLAVWYLGNIYCTKYFIIACC